MCIVPTAPHEVSEPRDVTRLQDFGAEFLRVPDGFWSTLAGAFLRSAPAPSSVMGGSKQHDATAPGATARRRKSKPRSRPASAARVPLTSAKQLIFGRKIGEGTQGEVRLARHATTGKRYVVKILDLDDPDDPNDPSTVSSRAAANDAKRQVSSLTDEEARAVETEADCLRMLSHPNVVRCHGTFRLDPTGDDPTTRRRSRLCIVMSHCEGGDLATLLARTKGQPLPEDAVMRWLVQLLLALDHVHSKNVLHRDLKPANVFLSKNLRCVKIGDFGIAKALEREDDLAVTRVGTPLYMSPELVTGQPYTYASDVWALGCVAYELASGGKRAFDADSLPQLMCKVMTCDYPPVPSHFSRQFERVVGSMLDPDPHERPTAAALLRHPFVRTHAEAWLAESRGPSPGGGGSPREACKPARGEGGGGGGGGASAAAAGEGGSSPSTGNSPREFAGRAPLDRALVEDAGARAARSIADVVRKVRRSEASSKTPTDPVSHRPNANPRRPPSRALVERERLRAVEARYAARQRHARESRAAVRENDPVRAERRRRAEEAAAARLAEQDARRAASAEEALLKKRGLVYAKALDSGGGRGTDGDEKSAPGDGYGDEVCSRARIAAAAFAPRPLLDRTDPGAAEGAAEARTAATTRGVTEGRDGEAGDGDEEKRAVRVVEAPSAEATAELMEALMAEARDDYEEAEAESTAEVQEEEKATGTPESVSALERELELCFADVNERLRVLHRLWEASGGRRRGVGTAPGGASRPPPPGEDDCSESPRGSSPAAAPRPVAPSASFDARPGSSSGPDDEAFAGGRDAELERRARAELRSFIRASVEPERIVDVATVGGAIGIEARASASFAGWAAELRGVADAGEGTSGSFDSDPDWRVEGASERDDPSD